VSPAAAADAEMLMLLFIFATNISCNKTPQQQTTTTTTTTIRRNSSNNNNNQQNEKTYNQDDVLYSYKTRNIEILLCSRKIPN
jgi:hypothetical protein